MSSRIDQLRAELDAHEKRCPGTHLECYGKPTLECARAKWIEIKDRLQTSLKIAIESEKTHWHDATGQPTAPGWKPDSMPEYPSARKRSKHYDNAHPWQKGIVK